MKRVAIIGSGFRPTGSAAPPIEIRQWQSSDIEVQLVEIADGVFPDSVEAVRIADQQYRAAGIEAAQAGYDAIYLNTIGDYGLPELRGAVSIPVIGSGDTAFRAAAAIGRFAIVTVWPPALNFIARRVLERSHAADGCTGIFNLTPDDALKTLHDARNFVTDLRACSSESLRKLEMLGREAVNDGAELIVYGCTCMAPAVEALGGNSGVHVIEPMSFGFRIAEYCARHGIQAEAIDFGAAAGWLSQKKGP